MCPSWTPRRGQSHFTLARARAKAKSEPWLIGAPRLWFFQIGVRERGQGDHLSEHPGRQSHPGQIVQGPTEARVHVMFCNLHHRLLACFLPSQSTFHSRGPAIEEADHVRASRSSFVYLLCRCLELVTGLNDVDTDGSLRRLRLCHRCSCVMSTAMSPPFFIIVV